MTSPAPLPSSCFASTLFNNNTWTSCPAGFSFTFGGSSGRLNAELTCPTDPYASSNNLDIFRNATQTPGICECTNTFVLPDNIPMNCECYGCPVGSNFGAGYVCEEPIFSICKSINCNGACNGPPDFPGFTITTTEPEPTPSPTSTTTEEVSALSTTATTTYQGGEECELVNELQSSPHYVCNANNYNLGTIFLQAKLVCPLEQVLEFDNDLTVTSHRGLCECETDLLQVSSRSFGLGEEEEENHIEENPIDCECYICPSNSIEKYAYSCDHTIINKNQEGEEEDCKVLNCDGICNGPLDFLLQPPVIVEPGSSSSEGDPEQSDDSGDGSKEELKQDNTSNSSGTPFQSFKKLIIVLAGVSLSVLLTIY